MVDLPVLIVHRHGLGAPVAVFVELEITEAEDFFQIAPAVVEIDAVNPIFVHVNEDTRLE